MNAVTHPRFKPRRGTAPMQWWSKAWARAVEEAAYHAADLRTGRALARRGVVGSMTVGAGSVVAAVQPGDDAFTVQVAVPVLSAEAVETLVELVAAESGRIADLVGGQLPHRLVEDAEDSGIEVLPYGSELATECSCRAWAQPCVHALAVLTQLTWLVDGDPLQLLLLRGLPRDQLLGRLHDRSAARVDPDAEPEDDPDVDPDVDTAFDAAVRAARILELLEAGSEIDHLL